MIFIHLLQLGMSEKCEYAIAAYLALCRIFLHIFSKVRISHILAFLAALSILCSYLICDNQHSLLKVGSHQNLKNRMDVRRHCYRWRKTVPDAHSGNWKGTVANSP